MHVVCSYGCFFFFSSRRRHTRSDRDWSSDVCSSDLTAAVLKMDALEFFFKNAALTDRADVYTEELKIAAELIAYKQKAHLRGEGGAGTEIGRASCRERV